MSTPQPKTPAAKSKTNFWLTIIGLTVLSVLLTIFTINFNLNQIKKAGRQDNLFSTIRQHFVKQFSQPTFILPATSTPINYQTITNY